MPGLVGIIGRPNCKKDQEDIALMVNSMMRESFYASGMYINDEVGVHVGWVYDRELFSDCMPIVNEKKDVVLIFFGENFVDKEIVDGLRIRGHQFATHDPSYLIHLYEEEEERFFEHLNGWFCGTLIDLRTSTIQLFNDRYGMGRLYYAERKGTSYFSSEAKALLRVLPDSRAIDEKGLSEYFACGCVLENRTLFKNILLLPSGSAWKWDGGGKPKKNLYFSPKDWEGQSLLSEEAFSSRLQDTFSRVLPKYFTSDVPIGLSLTGGLDTRMILSYWSPPSGSLPCYTFGGAEGDIYDIKIAKKVAKIWGQRHDTIRLGKNFFTEFDSLAEKTIVATDGAVDICGTHEIYLNKLARDIAPVRMTGNFGSEVLRGVSYFKARRQYEPLFVNEVNKAIREVGEILKKMNQGNTLSFTVFREVPWLRYGIFAAAQSQLTIRTPYLDNDLVKLAYQAGRDALSSNRASLEVIGSGDPRLLGIMTDQGVGGSGNMIARDALRKYYRFLFKAEYYVNDGMPHWLSKANVVFAPLGFDRLFLGRHKYLFYRRWFAEELSGFIREVTLDSRTEQRSFLNRASLRKAVHEHINGRVNLTDEISKVVAIELVHRLLLEGMDR
jgi:asparagine synthase (glutamine-hydrolysing)